ncbi:MAG: Ig-like domain-containing protein [Fidelibacterota bacterium]
MSLLTILLFAILALVGCSNDSQSTAEIVSVSPADGERNVLKTVDIQVEFSETMDPSSCESRFGLFPGDLENIPVNMMGSMNGDFSWNRDYTIMTFQGDSMLMDSAMYSICLQEGMMSNDGMGNGMMMSNMNGHGMEVSDGIISKFVTKNHTLARIVAVDPLNGSTEIDNDIKINIEYVNSMNTESCESRFGLHQGELTEMPMMGMMSGLDGTFHWNRDSTMMTFDPDSMLMDSTLYTICLMEGMGTADHSDSMILSNMSGHGNQVDGGIFSTFFTK